MMPAGIFRKAPLSSSILFGCSSGIMLDKSFTLISKIGIEAILVSLVPRTFTFFKIWRGGKFSNIKIGKSWGRGWILVFYFLLCSKIQ